MIVLYVRSTRTPRTAINFGEVVSSNKRGGGCLLKKVRQQEAISKQETLKMHKVEVLCSRILSLSLSDAWMNPHIARLSVAQIIGLLPLTFDKMH